MGCNSLYAFTITTQTMRRKATKNTRGPNADEKRFQGWIKQWGVCIACLNCSPVICHHCEGATFKHNKTLIGHWFCIPLCLECDNIITHRSRNKFREAYDNQCNLWHSIYMVFSVETGNECPQEIVHAIMDWGK